MRMKTRLNPRIYTFETTTRWTQNRRGVLSAGGKKSIEIACPPEFGGHRGYWTAEHLFVASIEVCIMTTFEWLMEKDKGKIVAYKSKSIGMAQMVDDNFLLNRVEITPTIVVSDQANLSKAKEAITEAGNQCLISKALNFEVSIHPVVRSYD
jgi:organic hydroperoxide reductase OsmC/OhrA